MALYAATFKHSLTMLTLEIVSWLNVYRHCLNSVSKANPEKNIIIKLLNLDTTPFNLF